MGAGGPNFVTVLLDEQKNLEFYNKIKPWYPLMIREYWEDGNKYFCDNFYITLSEAEQLRQHLNQVLTNKSFEKTKIISLIKDPTSKDKRLAVTNNGLVLSNLKMWDYNI